MSKCFITKYPQSVDNDNLSIYGKIKISVPKYTGEDISTAELASRRAIRYIGEGTEIQGGNFTDVTMTKNLGKTSNNHIQYISNEDSVLLLDKYTIQSIAFYDGITLSNSSDYIIDIEDFKYSLSLFVINLYKSDNITGDISSLSKIEGISNIGIYNCPNVTGDISSLAGLTALTYLNLSATGVSGDISSLAGLTALTSLNLSATGVTGTITDDWINAHKDNLKTLTLPKAVGITDEQKQTLTDAGCTVIIIN